MPCGKSKLQGRGPVLRYRVQKHRGKPFRVAVVPKAGPRGGHTVEWPEEPHHSARHHSPRHRRPKKSFLKWFFTGQAKF